MTKRQCREFVIAVWVACVLVYSWTQYGPVYHMEPVLNAVICFVAGLIFTAGATLKYQRAKRRRTIR
jgi:hypothetical protein